MTQNAFELITVEGVSLSAPTAWPDGQARIRDINLAEGLAYEQARMIRKLIRRYIESGDLPDICDRSTVERSQTPTGGEVEREVTEYWLTEEQALFIVTRSETPVAKEMTRRIIRVFTMVRRGAVPGVSADLVNALVRINETQDKIVSKLDAIDLRHVEVQVAQDRRLASVETRVEQLQKDLEHIGREIQQKTKPRARPTDKTILLHVLAVAEQGGLCPCCRRAKIVDLATRARIPNGPGRWLSECDHFFAASMPKPTETWLICCDCHARLTRGHESRAAAEIAFKAYQYAAKRILDAGGKQLGLYS